MNVTSTTLTVAVTEEIGAVAVSVTAVSRLVAGGAVIASSAVTVTSSSTVTAPGMAPVDVISVPIVALKASFRAAIWASPSDSTAVTAASASSKEISTSITAACNLLAAAAVVVAVVIAVGAAVVAVSLLAAPPTHVTLSTSGSPLDKSKLFAFATAVLHWSVVIAAEKEY